MPKKRVKNKIEKSSEKKKTKTISRGLAIACLVINIFIPGLGSLIGDRTKEGIRQLVLLFGGLVLGIMLTITIVGAIIGVPILVLGPTVAWIWGIVTGVKLIQKSSK